METVERSSQTERARLRAGNLVLRERLDRVERFRWWRLNPRRLATRVAPRRERGRPTPDTRAGAARSPARRIAPADDQVARLEREIVGKGAFSEHWFIRHAMTWEPILSGLEGRRARLLEIGSYEGLSACFMLWRLPDASVTCVDTFAGSLDHHATRLDVRDLEARFDANIAPVDSNRVRKCVGD
ncbi:MAG: hypothetical protein OEW52_07895 [Thermoleophilia bacterium]|nr:hypothetical protein [Thermoleophilia bacterium]